MNFSSLLRNPLFWIGALVLVLVLVLAGWHITRPTDAEGNSLILSNRETKAIDRDLARQAALRRQDSLQAVRADSAAAGSYRQGQRDEAAARRLQQQTRKHRPSADTSAKKLQQELNDY